MIKAIILSDDLTGACDSASRWVGFNKYVFVSADSLSNFACNLKDCIDCQRKDIFRRSRTY